MIIFNYFTHFNEDKKIIKYIQVLGFITHFISMVEAN